MQLRVGTRRSHLAKTQTHEVINQLRESHPQLDIQVLVFSSIGDQTTGPLPSTYPGLFTSTLDRALINEQIDFVVHSLKDLPTQQAPELVIAATPKRHSAFDVLVTSDGTPLDQLPYESTIGTSSLRRTAQLLSVRPDLKIELLRGNVDTRVEKVLNQTLGAAVLAEAGLSRLNIDTKFLQRIPMNIMLPAPGQGALAVECRKNDLSTLRLLERINCPLTRATTAAERTFLASTGGGCSVPIAAYAEQHENQIRLRGEIYSTDGCECIAVCDTASDPVTLGNQLAHKAIEMGAKKLLNRE
ncbi:MAG: hydroxymethylbilane synthase [Bacteroidetes bacterium]|nr:hydroxymethylbilane synthase [Bacteroidota bacterium]